MSHFKYLMAVCACLVFTVVLAETPTATGDVVNNHALLAASGNSLLPPVSFSPYYGAKRVSIPVDLQYELADGATRYNIQVSTDPSFAAASIVFRTNIGGSTAHFVNAEQGKTYYWRVQSVAPDGMTSKFGPTFKFTTVLMTLAQPVLLSPSNGAEGVSTTVTFRWTPVPGATRYILTISSFQDPSRTVRALVGPMPSASVTVSLGTGKWYWSVGADDLDQQSSPRSARWTFSTTGAGQMTAPQLLTPSNMQSNVPVSAELRFALVPEAYRYNVQVATDPDFANIVFRTNVPTSPTWFVGVPGGRYYWRVQAVRLANSSPFSPAWSFTVGSSAAVAQVENYPNPFNPTTVVAVDLPEATNIRVVVYDMLGHRVAELGDGDLPAGRHTFTFDASGLPSGVYMCRVESPEFTQTRRMLLLK